MNWFNIFKKRGKDIPKRGEIWIRDDENPFTNYSVTVLEVKDGWVLYSFNPGDVIKNSCKLSFFYALYKKQPVPVDKNC
jgi:hypothetical protein